MIKIAIVTLLFVACFSSMAQLKPVYQFQQDDSVLKKNYYNQALAQQNAFISSLGKEYKDDYKEIYDNRFKEVADLLQSSRTVTAPEAHQYLQSILKKIVDANDELKQVTLRLVFTRDWWPNAYSLGEGTLVVNAGLMIFLDNEAEMVFVLCHELAHYYLNHSNNAIKKSVETANSEEFKKEIKRLSKEEYRVGQQLEILIKKLAFGSRRHNRDNEAEADRQAFQFMKKTGYDCNGIKTCLEMLDKVDDSLLYKPLVPEKIFDFNEYPFKKKWIQKESSIFSQMKDDDSPLTPKEKDSLKTHPDCKKRIELLKDSVQKVGTGKKFIVNEKFFTQLKQDFFVEMTEQEYKGKNLTHNLYYSLQMLQNRENIPYAVYSVARGLNLAYESQKNHRLGTITDKESRGYPADYNLLLRIFDRLRLDEIAAINYYFCSHYLAQMTGYEGFDEEMKKAEKFRKESQF